MQFAQVQAQSKALSMSLQSQRRSKFFLKNSPTLQKSKKFNAQPNTDRQKNTRTMTVKTQSYSNFQTRWARTPAANSVLPQLAVKCKIEAECSYQTFVQVDSEALRNRQLRQHAKRQIV